MSGYSCVYQVELEHRTLGSLPGGSAHERLMNLARGLAVNREMSVPGGNRRDRAKGGRGMRPLFCLRVSGELILS